MAKRMKEKAIARKQNADRRPQATAKYVRISPSKVKIVLDIIRGKDFNEAMAILMGTPKAASEILIKILASAGANAENNLNMSKEDLCIAECFANPGPIYKRWWPRSHGSADTILKRTSHITIILNEKQNEVFAKPAQKAEATTTVDVNAEAKEEVKNETVAEKKTATKSASKTTAKKTTSTAKKTTTTKKGGAK